MKKLFSLILAFALMLSLVPFVSAVNVNNFIDVSPAAWYYDAVRFVTANGMFEGTSPASFSPDGSMTRGMFVTVLGRYGNAPSTVAGGKLGIIKKSDVNMRTGPSTTGTTIIATLPLNAQVEFIETVADSSSTEYTWNYIVYKGQKGYIRSDLIYIIDNGFSDVPADSYYSPYVQWAFSSGIAYESGAGTFSPERSITREEICSMLFNFSSYKNLRLTPTVAEKSFTDSGKTSSNYAQAVSIMQKIGVIDGYDDGSFRPLGSATRAEVSTMLMRYIAAISYKPSSEPSYDANGNYIFGTEVPAKQTVGDSYFSDACFIGHSLVVGMKLNFRLSNSDFFAYNGASAKSMLSYGELPLSTTHTDESGATVPDKGTLAQAISQKSYGKVYIMFGANDIGTTDAHKQSFYNNMNTLIQLVRKSQPNAVVYLISMTPVSQKCSESRANLSRDNIIVYNQVIKQLCRENRAYYLNVFDLIADSNGFLGENSSIGDGLHILSQQYQQIKSYLLCHTA